MPKLLTYRVFISHAWNYDEYRRIIAFLDNAPNFRYADYSVPYERAIAAKRKGELEAALQRRIRLTQVLIVPAGMEINYRAFIQYELGVALYYRKPIISVVPRGLQNTPRLLTEISVAQVKWNGNAIVSAIRSYSGRKVFFDQ